MDCPIWKVCEPGEGYGTSDSHTEEEALTLYCPASFTKEDKGYCAASGCMHWHWVKHRPPQDPPVGCCWPKA